jgi:hypothetical protein
MSIVPFTVPPYGNNLDVKVGYGETVALIDRAENLGVSHMRTLPNMKEHHKLGATGTRLLRPQEALHRLQHQQFLNRRNSESYNGLHLKRKM